MNDSRDIEPEERGAGDSATLDAPLGMSTDGGARLMAEPDARVETSLTDDPVRPRLFLADDNRGDGLLLDLAFTDAGYGVDIVQAYTGMEAFTLLTASSMQRPFPFSLVVIDLNMPMLGGLELLGRLGDLRSRLSLPMVIMTSSTDPCDRLRGLQQHPTAFLNKPDTYRDMAAVVRTLAGYLFPAGFTPRRPQTTSYFANRSRSTPRAR
jgi:CheY-like chemotaxis protein